MENQFFEKPILNSLYGYPVLHWELDKTGQPTQQIIEKRRPAEFITPIPKPKKQKGAQQEVPYRYGSEMRQYRPDFIVRVDDGHGDDDLLNLVVEIKGFRGEDAKVKKETMDIYWVPGVNNPGTHGWAFAEFTEVYQMQADFVKKVEGEFEKLVGRLCQ